jgi:hypothetical protein
MAPVLGYQWPGDFIIDTDASNMGNWGVLSKVQDGQEWVVTTARPYPELRKTIA